MAIFVNNTPTTNTRAKMVFPPGFLDPKLPKGVLSYSQYRSYHICARAYSFKYVDQISTPGYAAPTKGSAVHRGIEKVLTDKMLGKVMSLAQGKQEVSDEFDNLAKNVNDWGEIGIGPAKDESLSLFEAFYTQGLAKLNPVAIEKGFFAKFGATPVMGYIDLIDEIPAMDTTKMSAEDAALVPRERVTVDFKTSSSKWSEKDVRNEPQLTLYAAVENTPHVRIDQLIPYKKGAQFVQSASERTPQDVAILKEDFEEVADAIRAGRFPMTSIDSWGCNVQHCSFWALCRGRAR